MAILPHPYHPTKSHPSTTIVVLFLLFLVIPIIPTTFSLSETEALILFKNSLVNAAALNPTWVPMSQPCGVGPVVPWLGIICDRNTVTAIHLEAMGLSGRIDIAALSNLPGLRMFSITTNMFTGPLPEFNRLGTLTALYINGNQFSGEIPADYFATMTALERLWLSDNSFSGAIPPSLARVNSLVELHLEGNQFTGQLPAFTQPPLTVLNVANNKLEGEVPASLSKLDKASFANSGLCGPVTGKECVTNADKPPMAGGAAGNESPTKPDTGGGGGNKGGQGEKSGGGGNGGENGGGGEKGNEGGSGGGKGGGGEGGGGKGNGGENGGGGEKSADKGGGGEKSADKGGGGEGSGGNDSNKGIMVAAAAIVLVFFILLVVVLVARNRDDEDDEEEDTQDTKMPELQIASPVTKPTGLSKEEASTPTGSGRVTAPVKKGGKGGGHGGMGDLVMVNNNKGVFGLGDLMKASAEVLGGGGMGSAYKAVMANGAAVAVKRMRVMNRLGKESFDVEMRRLAGLKHVNLLPPLAYHFRKEEKLLVYEFIPKRSLLFQLHGDGKTPNGKLDWATRLKIIQGIARGMGFLHDQLAALEVPHGNLKSSNVLIADNYEPLMAEYGFSAVIGHSQLKHGLFAYKSPELAHARRASHKSDVYCFGLVVLETLTGKVPSLYLPSNNQGGVDVAEWVVSAVSEGREAELLDPDITSESGHVAAMVALLRVGAACVAADPDARPSMAEAIKRVEEIR